MAKASQVKQQPKQRTGSTPERQRREEAQEPQRVELDESGVSAVYANFARVSGTPEELVLDFGLNTHPSGTPSEPIQVSQRLVLNYFTAKRLLHALHLAVQRHESTFGMLETDITKRVTNDRSGASS